MELAIGMLAILQGISVFMFVSIYVDFHCIYY